MSGDGIDWEAGFADLGSDWTITRMTFKNHAACGHLHAAVDAVRALADAHGLAPDDVARIEAGSYAKSLEICGNPVPATAFEAKFSLPYCVGAMLVIGSVRRAAFAAEAPAGPRIRAAAAAVVHTVGQGRVGALANARLVPVAMSTPRGSGRCAGRGK